MVQPQGGTDSAKTFGKFAICRLSCVHPDQRRNRDAVTPKCEGKSADFPKAAHFTERIPAMHSTHGSFVFRINTGQNPTKYAAFNVCHVPTATAAISGANSSHVRIKILREIAQLRSLVLEAACGHWASHSISSFGHLQLDIEKALSFRPL
ncbi:MAG: hypothetical protein ACOH2H_05950 [Cypionkella sp.]